MQKTLFMGMLMFVHGNLLALSSNNTCLPVFADAVNQMGILNQNINGTTMIAEEVKIVVNRILDDALPTLIRKWDETAPEVLAKMDAISSELAAIIKLADERTNSGFVIGTTIGAAVSASFFGAIVYWSALHLKNKWFHRSPAAEVHARSASV